MENQSSVRYDYTLKIVLLGDHSVGKTSLIADMASQDYTGRKAKVACVSYRPNSHAEMDLPYHGKRVLTKIVDTGGQERFRSITASFYRGAQGCLILFDAQNSETFMNVAKWHEDLETYTSTQPTTAFLVGINTDSKAKQVSNEQAEQLATKLGMQYRQIKAKSRSKLLDIVEELLDFILVQAARLPSVGLDLRTPGVQHQNSSLEGEERKFICPC